MWSSIGERDSAPPAHLLARTRIQPGNLRDSSYDLKKIRVARAKYYSERRSLMGDVIKSSVPKRGLSPISLFARSASLRFYGVGICDRLPVSL